MLDIYNSLSHEDRVLYFWAFVCLFGICVWAILEIMGE